MMQKEQQTPRDITFWDIFKSVLAAFFGVQSNRNRERDFSQGKPHHFILIGLLVAAIFVLLVYTVVKLVLLAAAAA
ncbi:DUF2970 domain-containing protein [Aliamphritea hakodatensis]|uniref:DUF2970 domain-containing protein n=1 Tax=Aliamphritea hakodatensis TaxID=2895352 RepID=UPI0022FD81F7|nr:DUF2970 domain-containing protein [Aliamphritea hakodatensis]